ncbi:MAG TPA: peptidylprolyl isomerase [Candidatus Methylomirabilis sp.]|nr:peptidylprolyl isomerase [Candidatus Methylomirabilis sp.]
MTGWRWGVLVGGVVLAACTGGSEEQVVVRVNQTRVTVAEFRRRLDLERERIPAHLHMLMESADVQKRYAQDLIRREILLQEAARRQIDSRPVVTDRVRQVKEQMMLQTLLKEEISDKVQVPEGDVQAYYEGHPEEFSRDRLRAGHILVATEGEAQQVVERLKGKEAFEGLARRLSLDKVSGAKGGDLGTIERGTMVPEFEKAAYALKVGEVSAPVKTRFGFHIIRVTRREERPAAPLAQIREELQQRLLGERQQTAFDAFVEGLRQHATVEVQEQLLPIAAPGAAPAGPDLPATPPPPAEAK